LNGVPADRIYSHTVLIGVFLTPVLTEFAGNFTVWPTSHYLYERYFRERGSHAMHEPMPELQLGDPVQLCCDVGDVVLAHYSLGHTAAVNTSEQDRIAVFFRAVLSKAQANGWPYLTNIWDGWNL
jgi:ectoine hydroxylase-related dioxygenase (phytanoyl-CoA dioxygenase family)